MNDQSEMKSMLQEACSKLRDLSSTEARIQELQNRRLLHLEDILGNVIQVVGGLVQQSDNNSTSTQTPINPAVERPTQNGRIRTSEIAHVPRPMHSRPLGIQNRKRYRFVGGRKEGQDGLFKNPVGRRRIVGGSSNGWGQRTFGSRKRSMLDDRLRGNNFAKRNNRGVASNLDPGGPVIHDAMQDGAEMIHQGQRQQIPTTGVDNNRSPALLRASQSRYLSPLQHTTPTSSNNYEMSRDRSTCSTDQELVQGHLAISQSTISTRNTGEIDSPYVTVKSEEGNDLNSSCENDMDCPTIPESHAPSTSADFDNRGSTKCRLNASADVGYDDQEEGQITEEQQGMRSLQDIFTLITDSNNQELLEQDEDDLPNDYPSSHNAVNTMQAVNAMKAEHFDGHLPQYVGIQPNVPTDRHPRVFSKSVDRSRPRRPQHKMNHDLTMDVARYNNPIEMSRLLVMGSSCQDTMSTDHWTNPLSQPEEYNIREILESHIKGRPVLQELNEAKMPSIKNRRLLVQILVSYLVEYGGRSLYPTAEQKTALAKAVVTQFPCMKDKLPGAEGYEYLYHKGQGFVEFRLKNLRATVASHRRCSSGQSRRTQEPPAQEQSSNNNSNNTPEEEETDLEPPSEDILEKLQWLQCNHPTPENRDQLLNYFRQTHSYRLARLKKESQSIADVLHQFPCFKEMPSLIDYDFALAHEGKEELFLSTWHIKYFSQIMALGRRHDGGALMHIIDEFGDNGDSDLCALYLLTHLMPSCNWYACQKSKKGWKRPATSRTEAVSHLFQHKPLGTDVAEYALTKPAELTQPFLLCLGPTTSPSQFHLILGDQALAAGDSTVAAFDRLFKAHIALNAAFDPCLHFFFSFFSAVVYKCCAEEMTPQLRAFHILLNSTGEDDG